MPRKRFLQLALAAMALAAVLSLAAYRMLRGKMGGAAPAGVAVVAAAADLAAGAPLKTADLRLLRLPADAVPAGAYHALGQIAGHTLVAAAARNQVLLASMVGAAGAGVGLPPLIPPGMRAVSVKVNDVVSVAGYAIPGAHVDVLVTGNPNRDDDPGTVTTSTVLSNVQVLTAGQQLEQNPQGKPDTVTVITLLVDPIGAEKLALASSQGHIQLTLRNPLDTLPQTTPPLLNLQLYGGRAPAPAPTTATAAAHRAPAARPAPAPPAAAAAWPVEVIAGNQQQILNFPVAPRVSLAAPHPTPPTPATTLPTAPERPHP